MKGVRAERGLEELAMSLSGAGLGGFQVAFVLGSGLGAFADELEGARAVPFADLEGMPLSRVPGHEGRMVRGRLGEVEVLAMQGRIHLYEGWNAGDVTRAVRCFGLLGCRTLVLTNAAGGLHADWPVPCLMRIEDHLNMQGHTPLARADAGRGCPYDPEAGAALQQGAAEAQVELRTGVYAGLRGPSYETPSEVRNLARIGADAVGMSTVCEALAAHAAGMRVAAISCISNLGAGLSAQPLAHEEVVEAGRILAGDFKQVLRCATPHLGGLSPR